MRRESPPALTAQGRQAPGDDQALAVRRLTAHRCRRIPCRTSVSWVACTSTRCLLDLFSAPAGKAVDDVVTAWPRASDQGLDVRGGPAQRQASGTTCESYQRHGAHRLAAVRASR